MVNVPADGILEFCYTAQRWCMVSSHHSHGSGETWGPSDVVGGIYS